MLKLTSGEYETAITRFENKMNLKTQNWDGKPLQIGIKTATKCQQEEADTL